MRNRDRRLLRRGGERVKSGGNCASDFQKQVMQMTRINNKGLCRPRYLRLKDGLMGKVLPECGRDFCRVNEMREGGKRVLREGRQGMQTFMKTVLVTYPFQSL